MGRSHFKEADGAIGLTVMLDGAPTTAWTTTFNRIAEKRGRKAQRNRWDGVKTESNWVTVSNVEPGSELLLRDFLDGIVSAANEKRELERQAEQKADQDEQFAHVPWRSRRRRCRNAYALHADRSDVVRRAGDRRGR